jgi:hypothetical protein
VPAPATELVAQASFAAGVLGFDAANARAYAAAQSALSVGPYAQADFYQRLIGEAMGVVQHHQREAASANVANSGALASVDSGSTAGGPFGHQRDALLLLLK